MNTAEDLSTKAKSLYWQAFSITQISKEIGVSINTIYSWRRRYEWDKATPMQRVQDRTHVRYLRLVEKDDKTPKDFKEIDLLARQLDRFERHERRDQEKEKKAKTPKNHFTEEQITQLRALVFDSLYEHQKRWFKQWNRRNRFILKSRQIGATWYFAREALLRALETGNNQIFLSASRAQAFQFKRFIQKLAQEIGVELKGGDAIVLSNGATLYFLGTSAATAQSYTGTKGYAAPTFLRLPVKNMKPTPSGLAISSISTVHGLIGWISTPVIRRSKTASWAEITSGAR